MSLTNLNNYIVSPVPSGDPTSATITKYRTLRLLSLHTDPTCFGSNYERELQFSNETWRERLGAPDKVTVVAALAGITEGEGEWVGTVTIIAPAALRRAGFEPPPINADEVYTLFAMWVHPEHRRMGLGRRLIDVGLKWVRAHGRDEKMDHNAQLGRVVVLGVHENNTSARALYHEVGFREVDDLESIEVQVHMVMKVG